METRENKHDGQLENEPQSKLRKSAVNQLAIGSVILLWGCLLILKQIGLIEKNVSTWPFPLAAFGALLVVSGVYRLSKFRAGAG
jgi:hypothetical protein